MMNINIKLTVLIAIWDYLWSRKNEYEQKVSDIHIGSKIKDGLELQYTNGTNSLKIIYWFSLQLTISS